MTIALDQVLYEALRQQAERHGRSVDEEAAAILASNVQLSAGGKLWLALRKVADVLDGEELPIPPRLPEPPRVIFDE